MTPGVVAAVIGDAVIEFVGVTDAEKPELGRATLIGEHKPASTTKRQVNIAAHKRGNWISRSNIWSIPLVT